MEASIKVNNGRIQVKVEAANVKELFKSVATVDEIFNAEKECGLCHSNDLRFVTRTVADNSYFELRCESCSGRFQFGQTKAGQNLFPKRSNLPNNGWSKYSRDAEQGGE